MGVASTVGAVAFVFTPLSFVLVMARERLHTVLDSVLAWTPTDGREAWLCSLDPNPEDVGLTLSALERMLPVFEEALQIALLESGFLLIVLACCLSVWALATRTSGRSGIHREGASQQLRRFRGAPGVALGATCLLVLAWQATGQSAATRLPDAISAAGSGPKEDPCDDPAKIRKYEVASIDVKMVLNRFGDQDPNAYMYVLRTSPSSFSAASNLPLSICARACRISLLAMAVSP